MADLPGRAWTTWPGLRRKSRSGQTQHRDHRPVVTARDADPGHLLDLHALVQCLVRIEALQGMAEPELTHAPEVLDENRFLAARDGMEADFIDPVAGRRVPARAQLEQLLSALTPHAYDLGCREQLQSVRGLADDAGATDQLAVARGPRRLWGLVEALADAFTQTTPGFSRLET